MSNTNQATRTLPAADAPMGEWAAYYAGRRFYKIFPCKPDKSPYTAHGLNDASNDPEQVQAWWHEHPDAGIGFAIPCDMLVVDVDVQHGGTREQVADIPRTITARTGGGGWHLWTSVPLDADLKGKFADLPGVDVRKAGNYVILPPSPHPSGNRYAWEVPPTDAVLTPLPERLLAMVRKPPRPEHPKDQPAPVPTEAEAENAAAYYLQQASERCAPGTRNATGFWLACQLRDNGLTQEAAESYLLHYQEQAAGMGNDLYTEHEALQSLHQAYQREAREPTTFGDNDQPQVYTWREAAPAQEERPNALPHGLPLNEVTMTEVDWLWKQRVPLGMLTILDGDPGLGKSTITLDIAARLTSGQPFPDGTPCAQGNVILISLEDGAGCTIRPRFEAAGGDSRRVLLLDTINEPTREDDGSTVLRAVPFTLPRHFRQLGETITAFHAKLVVIDPLMGVLSSKTDSHKDQDIRAQVMAPAKALAEQTGCAFLFVRHLKKASSDNVVYQGGGSIGIIGATRAGLGIWRNPDNNGECVLATTKTNLAKHAPSLRFAIEGVPGTATSRIRWLGECEYSAQELQRRTTQMAKAGNREWGVVKQGIYDYLRENTHLSFTAKELAAEDRLDLKANTIQVNLRRLVNDNVGIVRVGVSRYRYSPTADPRHRKAEGGVTA